MRKLATKIAKKLNKTQSGKVVNLAEFKEVKSAFAHEMDKLPGADSLIKKGHEIQHALYTSAQNVLSLLIEITSELKELDKLNNIIETAQDMYMPSWPPMSPLSNSYFYTWASFDVRVGLDKESYTTCLLDIRRTLGLKEDLCHLLALMESSRLGIYKVIEQTGDTILLEELFDHKRYLCVSSTQHPPSTGELWLVRLLPPVSPLFNTHVIFTSPYILLAEESAWLEFFNRNIKGIGQSPASDKTYSRFMKSGVSYYYWPEFIMQSYSSHSDLSITLVGIPDIAESRPHYYDNKILPERTTKNVIFER